MVPWHLWSRLVLGHSSDMPPLISLGVSWSSFLDSRLFKGKQNRQHSAYCVPGTALRFLSASAAFIHLFFPTSLRSWCTTLSLYRWMQQLREVEEHAQSHSRQVEESHFSPQGSGTGCSFPPHPLVLVPET